MQTKHHTFQASFIRSQGDGEKMIVPAVLSTETPVKRSGYAEVLQHSAGSIDLSRFPLPVIIDHDSGQLNIAIAENPKISGGKLRADIRFGTSNKAREIFNDVRAGIISGVSAGYEWLEYEESTQNSEVVITVTRWKPYELSITAIPADQNAGFFRNKTMQDLKNQDSTDTDNEQDENLDPAQKRRTQRILKNERERVEAIRNFAKNARGVDDAFVNDLIKRGLSAQEAQAKILEKWVAITDQEQHRGDTSHTYNQGAEGSFGGYGGEHVRNAMVDGLLMRSGIKVDKPHPAARDFAHTSIHEMSRILLRERGIYEHNSSPAILIKRAMSTSDLPYLLENVANKALIMGLAESPQTHDRFCQVNDQIVDFKTQSRIAMSYFESLAPVAELGEVTYSSVGDSKETYNISSYQKAIEFSRQMLINDDLGDLTTISLKLGNAARRTEADLVYGGILVGNPKMADGKDLFHTTRGNLLTGPGSDLNEVAITNAILVLRRAKDIGGIGFLGLKPKFLIVPPELEIRALQLLASLRNTTANKNAIPDSDMANLEIIVEPRLTSATTWYLLADNIETVEVGRLAGNGISFETDKSFETDAFKMKVRLDAGAKALSPLGMIRCAGA